MSLSPEQRVISADDHLDIHAMQPGVWEERLPAALRERGPRVVDTPEGPFWLVEGKLLSPRGRKAAGMIRSEGHGFCPSDPRARLVLGEAGLGWVPYVLERCDHEHHKYYESTRDHRLSVLPSEIFAKQVFVTYEDEKLGVRLIPEIGIGNVMWASDYPHGDSTWPHSRRAIADSPLSALGAEAVRRIVCDNAAEAYGIP